MLNPTSKHRPSAGFSPGEQQVAYPAYSSCEGSKSRMSGSGAYSPVAAAGNRNGRIAWKVEGSGKTYGQWQEEKLAAAMQPHDESD